MPAAPWDWMACRWDWSWSGKDWVPSRGTTEGWAAAAPHPNPDYYRRLARGVSITT